MAPVKQGLDYFRYRMGLLKDRKLRKAKMKYGPAAPVVYLALLELIYSDKGYYLKRHGISAGGLLPQCGDREGDR